MSPKLRAAITTSESRRLLTQLTVRTKADLWTYGRLQHQLKALQVGLDNIKREIVARYDAYDPLALDAGVDLGGGYRVKRVQGHTTQFDKKLFVRLGGDLETYEEARRPVDTARYLAVTLPGTEAVVEHADLVVEEE